MPMALMVMVIPGPAASIMSPMIEVPPTVSWPRVTVMAASNCSAVCTNFAEAQRMGNDANRDAADAFAANVLPLVRQIQATGATTHRAIAAELNARGVPTVRGGAWFGATVRNLLARAPAVAA